MSRPLTPREYLSWLMWWLESRKPVHFERFVAWHGRGWAIYGKDWWMVVKDEEL